MTSKQLINQLCYEYNTKNYNEERLKTTQEIKKDLEILDILKRNIFVEDNMIYANPNELQKDDYKKLKEWYENDND